MDTRGFITEASAGIAGAAWSGGDLASKTAGPQRSNASPAPAKRAFMGRTEAVAATLPKPTLRLLSALDAAGAYAVADPTQDGMALVRADRDGVSVGAGLYPLRSAEDLARRDLAHCAATPSGRASFRISEAGRAHLRRRNAAAGGEPAYLAQQRHAIEVEIGVEGERVRVRMNAEESPLDWLRRRKDRHGEALVGEADHQAGERLRRDLTLAVMLPGVTGRWDGLAANRGRSGTLRDPAGATDAALAARQRATKALEAVGPDFADLLIDLCGFLKGLEAIERERGWPLRSAKVVVKLALGRLADHYGFQRAAHGPATSRGVRAWRAAVLEGGSAAP